MKIHKSFSKLELIDIFKNLDIKFIIDPELSKKEVIEYIDKNFRKFKITNKKNNYNIQNNKELRIFLKNENCNKILSIREKNNTILNAKRILNYCNNNFILQFSTFNSLEEIEKLALEICKYGYISSVRKAIKLLNNDTKMNKKFIIDIKNENKQDIKINYHCQIRTGLFLYDISTTKMIIIKENL
tara:strand:+ start:1555 stop:2112 length:558 start_codon:yes stop_codon:yes gene_type:complete